jgi:hypothetical protein
MSAITIEKTGKNNKKLVRIETDNNEHVSFSEQKLNKMRSILEASPVPAELLKRKSN